MEIVSATWMFIPNKPSYAPVIRAIDSDGNDYWPLDVNDGDPPWVTFLKTDKGKAFLNTAPPTTRR
jgi:hypothetical protein